MIFFTPAVGLPANHGRLVVALAKLPPRLATLRDLALDLRWTWSHQADALWEPIDSELWNRTRNP
jgi:hypothetical protein